MDRNFSFRASERMFTPSSQAPPPPTYPQHFPPPSTQPPLQIPPSDPFQTNRDPFLPGSQSRGGSFSLSARAWPPTQGNNALPNGHHQQQQQQQQSTPPPQHTQPLPPPPPPTNGITHMALPYDPSRRRSLGGPGSPPQHAQAPLEPPPLPPPSFQSRQMPPPSPPQLPSSATSLHGPAPRGPPTASPFAGARDLASFSSHRPAGGMSISSILGSGEDRRSHGSPNAPPAVTSTPKSMPPPSPGRARSSSMREGVVREFRDVSPPRGMFGEPRAIPLASGHDRAAPDTRKEGMFGSPQFHHGFRAFQPPQQDLRPGINGTAPPGRPTSQPAGSVPPPRSVEDMILRRDAPPDGRFATFRHFAEPYAPPTRNDVIPANEPAPFQNGHGPTSQPAERGMFSSPQMERERSQPGVMRFQHGAFGTPIREEQAGLFRPVYQFGPETARESIEARHFQDLRREIPRSSPPLSDIIDRARNGFIDRPMTLEEHQRAEAMQRDMQQRKESDGSTHRALLNISPELNRRGRNSPLPQAVQGAQPRHVGPGGDNPGIKMEFGRMFSGLGSGVGTATPTAGQSVNGSTTPSRLSPARHLESGDLVRTAVTEIEEGRGGAKAGGRKRNGRHAREDDGRINGTGRDTPDTQRGTKRAKTNQSAHHHHHHVHPHHHHHHNHEPLDNGPSPFNMLRFPSNPGLSHSSLLANPSHHHHHHHGSHAHPGHHHHHPPRSVPPLRKPTIEVRSKSLVEECAKKPRKHLGSQLYTTEISLEPAVDAPLDGKIKFSTKIKPIPYFEGKENCTYTVRVPRKYLAGSYYQGICKRRQVWGSDVYTDDSDVIAAAVHSGWIKGDFGAYNDDLRELCGHESEQESKDDAEQEHSIPGRPSKPLKPPPNHDAHITVLVLPPLESYESTNQHHVRSRAWKDSPHDGMSFMIHGVEFLDEGGEEGMERGAKARKERLKLEEAKRREAAAGLLLFAGGDGMLKVAA